MYSNHPASYHKCSPFPPANRIFVHPTPSVSPIPTALSLCSLKILIPYEKSESKQNLFKLEIDKAEM